MILITMNINLIGGSYLAESNRWQIIEETEDYIRGNLIFDFNNKFTQLNKIDKTIENKAAFDRETLSIISYKRYNEEVDEPINIATLRFEKDILEIFLEENKDLETGSYFEKIFYKRCMEQYRSMVA